MGTRESLCGLLLFHVEHFNSIDQLDDIFTKPVTKEIFETHRDNLGIVKDVVVSRRN